jgi:uncharacterized protein (TIGR02246 family)
MKCLCWLSGLCALIAGLVIVANSGAQDRTRKETPAPASAAANDAHAADHAAIDAVNAEFTRAFNAGDAAALAALFAEDARMSDEAGKTVEGRTAIQKRLTETFQESPGIKLVLRTDSVKFITPDVAVEEGASQVQSPGDTEETAEEFIPYTAIYVKKDGKWLHSVVRDYVVAKDEDASATAGADVLKELEWMVGEWVEEGTESKSRSACEWAQNKHFLVWNYTIEAEGANAPGGTMFIGWDPLTGQIKSWLFDAEGGHGEASWTRHGDGQWVVKATGVLGDGRTASATQYVTLLGKDLASWTSVDRVAGGEVQPDMSEFIIARKPPQPISANVTPRTR